MTRLSTSKWVSLSFTRHWIEPTTYESIVCLGWRGAPGRAADRSLRRCWHEVRCFGGKSLDGEARGGFGGGVAGFRVRAHSDSCSCWLGAWRTGYSDATTHAPYTQRCWWQLSYTHKHMTSSHDHLIAPSGDLWQGAHSDTWYAARHVNDWPWRTVMYDSNEKYINTICSTLDRRGNWAVWRTVVNRRGN